MSIKAPYLSSKRKSRSLDRSLDYFGFPVKGFSFIEIIFKKKLKAKYKYLVLLSLQDCYQVHTVILPMLFLPAEILLILSHQFKVRSGCLQWPESVPGSLGGTSFVFQNTCPSRNRAHVFQQLYGKKKDSSTIIHFSWCTRTETKRTAFWLRAQLLVQGKFCFKCIFVALLWQKGEALVAEKASFLSLHVRLYCFPGFATSWSGTTGFSLEEWQDGTRRIAVSIQFWVRCNKMFPLILRTRASIWPCRK